MPICAVFVLGQSFPDCTNLFKNGDGFQALNFTYKTPFRQTSNQPHSLIEKGRGLLRGPSSDAFQIVYLPTL